VSVSDRLAALTPEQRALLEQMRQERKGTRTTRQPPPIPRLSPPGGEGDWPLSFDQERLWFLSVLDPRSTTYNMLTATRMEGLLDVPVLRRAFDEVVGRQAAWRTSFPLLGDVPVQRVSSGTLPPPLVVDLSALPAGAREARTLALMDEAARQPFDLERGPLVRSVLIRLGGSEHLCLLTVHHIVSDWVTFQLFWTELGMVYEALLAGRSLPLPALPALSVQYSDFVVWQRQWLQGEALAHSLDWWMEQLRGFPQVLDLPADRPRPAVSSGRGGRHMARLDRALTGSVRDLARREGATRFMVLAAVCAALFHRLSGQEKIIAGTLNANRARPEVQPLFGFFLTQLPLALDLTGDPTFQELLARVRKAALGAFSHQELPFGKLVEALQPERETSRMPLVQTLVQLIDTHGSPAGESAAGQRLANLHLEPLEIYDGNTRYDLMFAFFENADTIGGPLEYNAEIFDPTTVARWLELFHALTAAATADPALRLSALPAFPAAVLQQVLLEWNDTALAPPLPTVVEIFRAQAARTPGAVAWEGDGWSLTWAGLDERSDLLARRLRSLGAGPGELVGIYLERTADLPVALLGTLKSGAAYLPLDLAHPPDRRAFMLEDARAAVVLTHQRLLPGLPEGVRAVCLDAPWPETAPGPLDVPVLPESRAYVIYTSGSTGRPKGVEISHGALASFVQAMRRLYRVEAGDAMPAITTIAFDLSVPELYLPMLGGGTTPLLTRETASNGKLLARALDDHRATVLQATPATYRLLLNAGWRGRPELLLLCGAEALGPDLAAELLPLGRGLWNFYGPTETTVWSAAWKVEADVPISIGRPIANTRIHLVDPRFAPVPLGAAGEVCIGGAGLASGYLRRPALTAERFIPDPFSAEPGSRLYRTGDLARHRPDGLLDYLGRIDHQVKLRGFRIELGEIEAALRAHPAVSETVVVLREDPPGDPRLVAYFALAPGHAAPSATELRELLTGGLPEYMVPSAFVPLPKLPRNANGKVDRPALPVPEGIAALPRGERVAPRDEAEAEVAAIWARLLGTAEVGVLDNFFELGGHSLLAHRVLAAVRESLGVEIPLRVFFQQPTVAGIAAAVAAASRETAGADPDRVERLPRTLGEPQRG